jgi:hypothetical protein
MAEFKDAALNVRRAGYNRGNVLIPVLELRTLRDRTMLFISNVVLGRSGWEISLTPAREAKQGGYVL